MVRSELRRTKGNDYARSFKVKGLPGIARLALPKDKNYINGTFMLVDDHVTPFIESNRITTLAHCSMSNVERLKA